jgi:N-acetylmuramoyl-L-alanine amidase
LTAVAVIALVLTSALAAVGSPSSAAAAAFAVGDEVVVNTDALNLRDGPGTANQVIAVLESGTIGKITDGPVAGDSFDWYELSVTGVGSGWVAGTFLATAESGAFPVDSIVVVNTDALNVRSGAGISHDVVTTLFAGDQATVTGSPISADGYAWYPITSGDQSGWVAGDFLTTASADSTVFASGDGVIVNTDALNVRADPGLDGRVVGTIFTGDYGVVSDGPVYRDGYSWYRLRIEGVADGWVAGDFLIYATDSGSTFKVGDRVAVNADVLNVRSDVGLSGAVVDDLPFNEPALISGGPVNADGYTWYQVSYNGGSGWVAGSYLMRAAL